MLEGGSRKSGVGRDGKSVSHPAAAASIPASLTPQKFGKFDKDETRPLADRWWNDLPNSDFRLVRKEWT
jgi:hypothetical protein